MDVYKLWHRSGFVSVSSDLLARTGKFAVSIGEIDPDSKKLKSSSDAYLEAYAFLGYLRAIANGTAAEIYPKREGLPTPESFIAYGGANSKEGPISRVFKAHPKEGDDSRFAWKVGIFPARTTKTGAFVPAGDLKQSNFVYVPRSEIPGIAMRLEAGLLTEQFKLGRTLGTELSEYDRQRLQGTDAEPYIHPADDVPHEEAVAHGV